MKFLILSLIMVFSFSGCVTDKPYAVGKVIYTGARTAYIELPLPANGTLENVDTVLVQYDKVRTGVREVTDKKKGKDANISR
jgi:hypothetical protein